MPDHIQLGGHSLRSHGAKLARFHMHDWVILILLAIVDGCLNLIEPFHRFVGEGMMTDLRYPMKKNTVPFWAVPILGVLLPFSIILGIYFRRRNVFDLHNAILGLLYSVLITGVITDAIKDAVGRPRPDFFWRCFPDGIPNYEDNTTRVICHGEKSVIREGHKSFPSGHSSWSFAGLGFLSWYLAGKLTAFDGRGHVAKLCIVFLPLLAAAMVAISRVDDYWHHWQDVFAGGFLGLFVEPRLPKLYVMRLLVNLFTLLAGLVVASFCYLQFFPPPYDLQGWLPHAYLQAVCDTRDNVPLQPIAASSLRTRPSEVETVAVASGHQDGSYARNTSTILDSMEAGRRNGP